LYRSGCIVGKYISFEKLIEQSKESYYEALYNSSEKWHDNENDYMPFLRYYLGLLIKGYTMFEERIAYLSDKNLQNQNKLLKYSMICLEQSAKLES